MAIFVACDKVQYFPSVSATGDALSALLLRAQSFAEGPFGANRRLDLGEVVSTINLNRRTQIGNLPLAPIVSITKVEARQKATVNRFARSNPTTAWYEVASNGLLFDGGNSTRVHYNFVNQFWFEEISGFADQLRVTYQTGFDFNEVYDDPTTCNPTATISDEAKEIKVILGQFTETLWQIQTAIAPEDAGDGIAGPVIEESVDYVSKIKYANTKGSLLTGGGKTASQNIEEIAKTLLLPLKRWQPRRWA